MIQITPIKITVPDVHRLHSFYLRFMTCWITHTNWNEISDFLHWWVIFVEKYWKFCKLKPINLELEWKILFRNSDIYQKFIEEYFNVCLCSGNPVGVEFFLVLIILVYSCARLEFFWFWWLPIWCCGSLLSRVILISSVISAFKLMCFTKFWRKIELQLNWNWRRMLHERI